MREETLAERFWPKVNKTDGCWEWTASKDVEGYGRIGEGGKYGRPLLAHRVSWFFEYGVWPKETIDHLCRNRGCVRPSHLEDVSMKENILRGESPSATHARKTHCPQSHPYSGNNLYVHPNGSRRCRKCHATHERRRRASKKVEGGR